MNNSTDSNTTHVKLASLVSTPAASGPQPSTRPSSGLQCHSIEEMQWAVDTILRHHPQLLDDPKLDWYDVDQMRNRFDFLSIKASHLLHSLHEWR